jgi:hypothetical protein
MVLQWPAGATIDAAVGAGQDANSPTAAEPGRPAGRYASTS